MTRFFRAQRLSVFAALIIFFSTTALATESNPIPDSPEWKSYYKKSAYWHDRDAAALASELKKSGLQKPSLPTNTTRFGFEPPEDANWFNSPEGTRILAAILSFQTPSGGWSKRTDMSKPRQAGQAFGVEEEYIPTFDNDATSFQLQLLARAYTITRNKTYEKAFARGLQLILDAQYPNGGWPQNYPLVGGYHDHITYNDNLMRNLMALLKHVADGTGDYAFTSRQQRKAAHDSLIKGLDCIVKTQVLVNGTLTIWGAQHDRITLAAVKARNFEMVSLATAESAALMQFLMSLEQPDARVVTAVHAAAAWMQTHKITGKRWERDLADLVDDANAAPLWARFYEIGTNKPLFGDRDNSIHYTLSEISEERRKGYAWYNTAGNKLLENYQRWTQAHPLPGQP
jgi:PelA/Pel-15E family pectate lyase